MRRYYFHVRRGQVTVLDQEGLELSSLEEASRRALQLVAREELTELPASIGMIIVDDEFGTVLELPLGDDRQSAYLPKDYEQQPSPPWTGRHGTDP
jgi:hypothetical protein